MDASVGNVHSGATPPWLREDDDNDRGTSASGENSASTSSSSVTFGPSLDEFIKHSKLNDTCKIKFW